MSDKKTFGEFMVQKRKEVGLTQKSFADKLFVTESAVSKWERGISFPDITLIRDICEVLGISEHELLTASEDIESRNTEKLARKYMKMIERYKMTLYLLYGVSLAVCFICNLVISHTISWFFLVFTSELVAFSLTLLPVLLQKNRGLFTLISFFGSLTLLLLTCSIYSHGDWFILTFISFLFGMTVVFLPFVLTRIGFLKIISNNKALVCFSVDTVLLFMLLYVCDLYTDGGWFLTRAVPISLFSLVVPWSMMLIIRYTKMNGFLKTAACISVLAAFAFLENGVLSAILGEGSMTVGYRFDFHRWNPEYLDQNINMIIFLWLILMSVIFAIAGIIRVFTNKGERDD